MKTYGAYRVVSKQLCGHGCCFDLISHWPTGTPFACGGSGRYQPRHHSAQKKTCTHTLKSRARQESRRLIRTILSETENN